MKILILYRRNSEHGRMVDEFIHEFQIRTGVKGLEILDIDSRDGGAIASLYDILEYPAILAIRGDGALEMCWTGQSLPLIDEVASYAMYY